MLNYLGTEFLQSVHEYYVRRYQLAQERGYTAEDSQYYWLFEELRDRILVIRQAEKFLHALPNFMQQGNEEKSLQYVVSFVSSLCGELTNGAGEVKHDSSKNYNDNLYWKHANEIWELMKSNYDMDNLPLLYVDLAEYLIRALRFHFYLREQVCRIDAGKFDEIMKLNQSLVVAKYE